MVKSLEVRKDEKVDALEAATQVAESTGNDTENQLSNNLISVTLAFVALLATAISTSNVIQTISFSQKLTIVSSIIVFCISIFSGLINYYLNMRRHQKTALSSDRKVSRAEKADTSAELNAVQGSHPATKTRSNALIIAQIVLLAIGLVLCVTFITTLLFVTADV